MKTATYKAEQSVPVHVYRAHKNYINYRAYQMLVAIANYSENDLCRSRAQWILEDNDEEVLKQRVTSTDGGFMTAVYMGEFDNACRHSDVSNREALATALFNGEIQL